LRAPQPVTRRLEIALEFHMSFRGHTSAGDVVSVKCCGSAFRAHRLRNEREESKGHFVRTVLSGLGGVGGALVGFAPYSSQVSALCLGLSKLS